MIKEKLALVPNKPGCYLMKNKDGVIIYVGKAKKLKNRLNSYFHGSHTGKTAKLVSEIIDFEYVVVSSETESLILELNLIKKYDPKYNILLRDDKSYPYIELTNEKVPRLLVVRNVNRKKSKTRLFGPYPNSSAAKNTVNLLNRIYPLRKCKTYNKKPCLYFHIGQCLGYCTNSINEDQIQHMEKDIIRFLKGDHSLITKKIEEEMYLESEKLNFETAAELKQLLDYINITLIRQKVEINDELDRDVIGYYADEDYLSIQIFFIRSSKIVERHFKIISLIDEVEAELTRYIAKFYQKMLLPKEILVPQVVETETLSEFLGISVKTPVKGTKKKLVEMANNNAKITLEEKITLIKQDEEKTSKSNDELKELLGLQKLDRIELFDNSNLFGSYTVSGMVVFIDGKPAKNEYRKYKISFDKNDDYGAMREVIYRRYFKVLSENLVRPDLLIVDGSIGQMNIAREIIDELGLNIMIVGLKKDDKHRTESLMTFEKEIPIPKRSNLFYYLERMQDEVHEFTINYHKQLRSKGAYESVLDKVPGIGEKRRKSLLKKYKSIKGIKESSDMELAEIIPENIISDLRKILEELT